VFSEDVLVIYFCFCINTIGDLPRLPRRKYYFYPRRKGVKFEIHYLIKLKEMSAESNVMEGLKGGDETTARQSYVARRKT